MPRQSRDLVPVIGLILGATLGIAGTFVSSDSLRQIFWAIDGIAVIVATTLLAVRFLRSGDDTVAAGFIVFALGESLLISGTAAGLGATGAGFCAATGAQPIAARKTAAASREREDEIMRPADGWDTGCVFGYASRSSLARTGSRGQSR